MFYTIEYYNETACEWRGTGSGRIYDKDAARQRMRALAEMTDYTVHFRLERKGS